MMRLATTMLLLLAVPILAGGCATAPSHPASGHAPFILVYLKTGPSSGTYAAEEQQKIFRGHMANIHHLADIGKLCIAGPFEKPHDSQWRGIFIMNVTTVAEAKELVATDPGVASKVFVAEYHPIRSTARLVQTLELEKALPAQDKPSADGTPPNIRGYAMVTSKAFDRTRALLMQSTIASDLIFECRLEDSRGGVWVFDLPDAAAATARLGTTALDAEFEWIDTWYSSVSVGMLADRSRKPVGH